ncbi:MAG: hypothetical protein WCY12_02305 [Candidatus Omnitrophota bacterium]|jgi:hypothetical protein
MDNFQRRSTLFLIVPFLIIFAAYVLLNCVLAEDLVSNRGDTMSGKSDLVFEVELAKQTYKIDESITLKCKLKNIGEEVINLMPNFSTDTIIYLKRENQDQAVPFAPRILPKILIKKDRIIELMPKQFYYFEIVLCKEIFIMPRESGHYKLYLVNRSLMREFEGIRIWTGEIESNIVSFELI